MSEFDIRAFFAARADGWDERFPDDGPAYARAVTELAPPTGGVALDLGCGTGRATGALKDAVGPDGTVLGVDLTPEMLETARRKGRLQPQVGFVLGNATELPVRDASIDAVLAAGLVEHLANPVAGLREITRVVRSGGRIAVFHPIGRAALAARHGRVPSDEDVRAPARLRGLLADAGWDVVSIDDAEDRYLALATLR